MQYHSSFTFYLLLEIVAKQGKKHKINDPCNGVTSIKRFDKSEVVDGKDKGRGRSESYMVTTVIKRRRLIQSMVPFKPNKIIHLLRRLFWTLICIIVDSFPLYHNLIRFPSRGPHNQLCLSYFLNMFLFGGSTSWRCHAEKHYPGEPKPCQKEKTKTTTKPRRKQRGESKRPHVRYPKRRHFRGVFGGSIGVGESFGIN